MLMMMTTTMMMSGICTEITTYRILSQAAGGRGVKVLSKLNFLIVCRYTAGDS